jgi:hypothetical protein
MPTHPEYYLPPKSSDIDEFLNSLDIESSPFIYSRSISSSSITTKSKATPTSGSTSTKFSQKRKGDEIARQRKMRPQKVDVGI